jgi:signal peptidase I
MSSQYARQEIPSQAMPNEIFAELMASVLHTGTPFRFQASGSSMDPFIKNGDVITVTPPAGKGAFWGDIVAFTDPSNGRLTVHRVVRNAKGRILVKGDNSPQPDGWIGQEQILGGVTTIERLGRPVRFGLGSERRIIALLSRYNFLLPSIRLFWPVLRPFFKGIWNEQSVKN